MKESTLLAQIRNTLGRLPDVRIWRNTVGAMRDIEGRYIVYGLCPGSADLIGIKTITIRPEHVGTVVGILVAIECKSDSGRTTKQQENFLHQIKVRGGLAGVARTVDEALALVTP